MSKTTLPYFRVISSGFYSSPKSNVNMSSTEIPIKPKRKKKVDVPIHTSNKLEADNIAHKTYGAQFNQKRRHKHKYNELKEPQSNNIEINADGSCAKLGPTLEIVEADVSKIKKKTLIESHERIYSEYQHLLEQVTGAEEGYQRKMSKLKDKLAVLQKINEDVIVENTAIKGQYENLVFTLDDYKIQLENSKHCKRCDEFHQILENTNIDNDNLKSTNKQLIEDVNMLKNVVYRLNVQMERYQEKFRKDKVKLTPLHNQLNESYSNLEVITNETLTNTSDTHLDHPHIPISWGPVNSHTLGPLLNSYRETINEKDEIIHNYETEISNASSKLKEIMEENENLHKRLTIDDKCSIKLKEELNHINLELKNTKSHNDLLIKKCALKQDKLEEVLRCYEQKVEQLRRDYNVVIEQYHKSRTEVAGLKEKNKALIEYQDEFKHERQKYIPISVHNTSVNECKQLYEELKHQYELEKVKLKEKSTDLHSEIEQLTTNIEKLKCEKESLTKKIETYERQVKKFEGKSLDMKQSLQEVQLSRTACKKQLHKAMEFAKELVSEQEKLIKALQHRQEENKAVKQIGSDMANRMDTLKSKLKVVQRDAYNELSSVEQRIKDQDAVIMNMKSKYEEEISRLQKIIREKEANLLLRNDNSNIPTPSYLLLRDRNLN